MHMKLQKFKQNTIRFIVMHPLLVALANKTFMVVKYFESIGIAQVYPIREMPTLTALVTVCKNYFY